MCISCALRYPGHVELCTGRLGLPLCHQPSECSLFSPNDLIYELTLGRVFRHNTAGKKALFCCILCYNLPQPNPKCMNQTHLFLCVFPCFFLFVLICILKRRSSSAPSPPPSFSCRLGRPTATFDISQIPTSWPVCCQPQRTERFWTYP